MYARISAIILIVLMLQFIFFASQTNLHNYISRVLKPLKAVFQEGDKIYRLNLVLKKLSTFSIDQQ